MDHIAPLEGSLCQFGRRSTVVPLLAGYKKNAFCIILPLALHALRSGGGGNTEGGVRGVWGNTNSVSTRHNEEAGKPSSTEAYGGGGNASAGAGGRPGEGRGGVRDQDGRFVGRTGGGDTDGGYEGKLVEEVCAAGGTKSTPGKVKNKIVYFVEL